MTTTRPRVNRKTYRNPHRERWAGMIERCENPRCASFAHYGARGITVCERWRSSFANFLADMGTPPTTGHTLDRIDNDGNYEPGNVRWATMAEQNRNRRSNRLLTFCGDTMCIVEWGERLGLSGRSIRRRLGRGWSVERALGTPAQQDYNRAQKRRATPQP